MTSPDTSESFNSRESSAVALSPADFLLVVDDAINALRRRLAEDWSEPATGMDWDCRTTLLHMASALDRYALSLAGQLVARLPHQLVPQPETDIAGLLLLVRLRAQVLAAVVLASPADARAFHVFGRPDCFGFLAMATTEIILHTHDITGALGIQWAPPEPICAAVLSRLFPWVILEHSAWDELRWATGRYELPGRGRVSDQWAWFASPLTEWDGKTKSRSSYQ